MLTAYAPSPGHGGVSDALTDERYTAVPPDAVRWGMAALVTIAAPMTFVSNAARQVAASVSTSRASGPMPGRVDERVDATEPCGGFRDRGAARRLVGDVALDHERPGAGLLRRVLEPGAATGEQRDLRHPAGRGRCRCTGRVRWTRPRRLLALDFSPEDDTTVRERRIGPDRGDRNGA